MDRSMKLLGLIPHFKHTVANYRSVQYLQFLALAPRRKPRHRLTGLILPYPRGDHCVWSITYTCSHPLARISVLWTILSAEFIAGSPGICPGSVAFTQQLSRSAPLSTSLLSALLLPPCGMSYTCLLIPEVRKKKTIMVPCRSASQFVRLPPSSWHHAPLGWAQSRTSAHAKHASTVSSSWLFTRRNSDCCLLRLTFSPLRSLQM